MEEFYLLKCWYEIIPVLVFIALVGQIQYDYLVDASGQSCVVGKKSSERVILQSMDNKAVWAYWKNTNHIRKESKHYIYIDAVGKQEEKFGWTW